MHVVALRPHYEIATKYGQYWCEELYNKHATKLGYVVVDLYREICTQTKLIDVVESVDPVLIAGVCHGNVDVIVGQYNKILFKVGDENTAKIVKGRHVWMLSCLAGKELLPWMVNQCGAETTMGYKEEFIFVISSYPNSYAEPFFRSHFSGLQAFLNGKRAIDAFNITLSTFKKYLDDPKIPEQIKPYLLHDMKCAVFFGNGEARINPPGGVMKRAVINVKMKRKGKEKAEIIFNVTDEVSDMPIPGVSVRVDGIDYPKAWAGKTDENGKFVISDAVVGRYKYKLVHEEYETVEGEITPDMFHDVGDGNE